MNVVSLSDEAKVAYGVFSWLRKQLPKADICTLRHISVYIAVTNDKLDIDNDLKLIVSTDETMCNLLLKNDTEIRFENSSKKSLKFVVDKHNEDIYMSLFVSTFYEGDLSSAMILGRVISDDWLYVIKFNNNDDKLCYIETYYKNKILENGISHFKLENNSDIGLDRIDGLGNLTDVMVKLDLLYNNVRNVKINKLVKRRCI